MSDNHTSKVFDLELESLRTRVLQMGGLVEQQVRRAIDGLYGGDTPLLEAVIRDDERVNRMEVEIDALCNQIIAKRQPAASDLRMIVSVMKAISDIERVGDKARKIARLGISIASQSSGGMLNIELGHMSETALRMLRLSLDGFARLEVMEVLRPPLLEAANLLASRLQGSSFPLTGTKAETATQLLHLHRKPLRRLLAGADLCLHLAVHVLVAYYHRRQVCLQ